MTIRVRVARAWHETKEVRCFELEPVGNVALPPISPGAHIDVFLPGRLTRQYSLCNGPLEKDRYIIGVKLEPSSRGGSVAMHGLSQGDEIEIGPPRNNFRLSTQRGRAVLLAGGIGITPLLSMARHLKGEGLGYSLHHFVRSPELAPFRNLLCGEHDSLHCGLIPPSLNSVLERLISDCDATDHIYVCGPEPFIELVTTTSKLLGCKDENVHVEYFTAATQTTDQADSSFDVILQRTGATVHVRADQTIIEALAEAGVDILTSCEQGVCGTCVARVIEGRPDHRDRYFSEAERKSGAVITPCVSRCAGNRLVLDL